MNDWLTKDGQAKGDVTPWIDAITQETHRWPQHILSYVSPALLQLHESEGIMTREGLNSVLKKGRVYRTAYYTSRACGLGRTSLIIIAKVLNSDRSERGVLMEEILAPLTQHYDYTEANQLFQLALRKGVLDERDDRYVVPVPTMHD